jgi:hypothetical protein
MCKWGTDTMLRLLVDKDVSYTKDFRVDDVKVDSCIALFIWNLNVNGVRTVNSCCGHGKGEGSIILASGARIYMPTVEVAD